MHLSIQEFVNEHMAASAPSASAGDRTRIAGVVQEVIAKLRAAGVTLPKIFEVAGRIVELAGKGQPAAEIVAAILKLLGSLPAPAPVAS